MSTTICAYISVNSICSCPCMQTFFVYIVCLSTASIPTNNEELHQIYSELYTSTSFFASCIDTFLVCKLFSICLISSYLFFKQLFWLTAAWLYWCFRAAMYCFPNLHLVGVRKSGTTDVSFWLRSRNDTLGRAKVSCGLKTL